MNSKIGSGEVMVIVVAIVFSLFPDFVILTTSKNASLLSLIIGFIIGLIPVMMIYLISKKINTSFFSFLKEKFKSFGYIINIILILATIPATAIGISFPYTLSEPYIFSKLFVTT